MGLLSFLQGQPQAAQQPQGLAAMLGGQQAPSAPQGGLNGFLGQLTQPTNVLGQIGKAISQASGGAWGDALTLMDAQKRQEQQDQQSNLLQQLSVAKTLHELQQPKTQMVGKAFGTVDDQGAFHPTYTQPDDAPKPSPLEAQINLLKQYNPGIKDADIAALIKRAIPGEAYDPDVLAAKNAYTLGQIGARGAQSRATKGVATYGQLHPANGATGGGGGGPAISTAALLAALGGK